MKVIPTYFYLVLLLFPLGTLCQEKVQTLVPHQPIQVGEAFQVQFITTGNALMIQAPDFGKNFELISGPRVYQGTTLQNNIKSMVQNFSYTLVPLRKGRLAVKGATFTYEDKRLKCSDAMVVVQPAGNPLSPIPVADMVSSPGPDVFVEAVASKKECYVGEPVVATFTLFSKLSSASEIIKNPGFYGFSVVDMSQATEGTESVVHRSGSFYNTHILRKVQLYPVQLGKLVIDEMRVNYTVEKGDHLDSNLHFSEKLITSKPLAIQVRPLPRQEREFSGAVGNFLLFAYLITDQIECGKSGKLVVTLSGKGNFLQIGEPEIQWPAGVEVFKGPVTEVLNTNQLPVEGNRKYEYHFTTDSIGSHTIPAVRFTFFNPVEKKYRTLSTRGLRFLVKPARAAASAMRPRKPYNDKNFLWPVVLTSFLAIAALIFYRRGKKFSLQKDPVVSLSFAEKMKALPEGDYRQLQLLLQDFLKVRYGIPGCSKNGPGMQLCPHLTERQRSVFTALWEECERVQYYNALPETAFPAVKQRAIALLEELGAG